MVTFKVRGCILLIVLLKVCVGTKLKCSVNNAVVSIQVQLPSKVINNRSSYIFRTKNQHTFVVKNYTDCSNVGNDTLNCSVWRGDDAYDIVYKYYNSPYLLQINSALDGSVVWNDSINTLNNMMYSCFQDHSIKDLKITLNHDGRALEWKTNKWDEDYQLIHHHSIKIYNSKEDKSNPRIVNDNFDRDCFSVCSVQINQLRESQPDEVCVFTHFKATKLPLRKCVTTVVRRPFPSSRVSPQFRIIISITLSLAGLIVLVLAAVVVSRKCNEIRCRKANIRKDSDNDNDSRIFPRSAGPLYAEPDVLPYCLSPQHEAIYSYPDFPIENLCADDETECEKYLMFPQVALEERIENIS